MAATTPVEFGPLGANGETPSRLDPSKTLSYDRWAISIVYGGTVCNAIGSHPVQTTLARLASHARIVIEQVTKSRGYRVHDCDLLPMPKELGGLNYGGTRSDAYVRSFSNIDRTLQRIQGSTGVLVKTAERIRLVLEYIHDKERECGHYSSDRLTGRETAPTFFFDLMHPDPKNNILNCITFTFEAARAGGINLYALYNQGRMIPRRDIRDIGELVNKAIDENYPLDEELREYIEAYEDESKEKQKAMGKTIIEMGITGERGPLVMLRYRHLAKEAGVPEDRVDEEILMEAVRDIGHNLPAECVNAAGYFSVQVPLLLTLPPAIAVESVFSHVVTKKRSKKATLQFFEEE